MRKVITRPDAEEILEAMSNEFITKHINDSAAVKEELVRNHAQLIELILERKIEAGAFLRERFESYLPIPEPVEEPTVEPTKSQPQQL